MDRQAATRLITETLSQPFDEGRFRTFVINLLNHLDEKKAETYSSQYIKDAFKDHVRMYKRVGKYTDPDGIELDVMIVYLRKETSLDYARTMQRNFITDYLKTRGQKEAGIVAYVGSDPSDWRFSLIRIDYRTEQTPSGRVKVKEELTPARRYSFLVGKNEPNHTAQQQFYPILQDSRNDPAVAQLEAAFNIESVTKDFFEKYKELFLELKEELDGITAKNPAVKIEFERCIIDTAGFAKKLLGQIVFLYFLQKKGWLGVQPGKEWGTGPKNYLFELFQKKHGNYSNYFNDILEPLFYEALAIERKDSFYPRLNCKIPFLNGGLFEPSGGYDWKKVDILIRNETFGNIFKTFNLYNFTVREDEPLEREVAVDPEMLGKVFENLLEVQDRKSKGAFYTPREIVHYMCQESLINYLDTTLNREEQKLAQEEPLQGQLFGAPKPVQKAIKYEQYAPVVPRADIELFIRHGETMAEFDAAKQAGTKSYAWKMPESVRDHAQEIDRALAEIRICDPAIGSGAFPVGMMSEIVKARQALTTYLPPNPDRSVYASKRQAIEKCIYGVDIDASAVDIARLRLWLSLVVDEDDFHTIKPLPNLDYKIVVGNSLQSVKQGYLAGEIEAKKEQFQIETDQNTKDQLRAEINRILGILTRNFSQFDFRVYFSEVFRERGGFDVVIANPPYVRGETVKSQMGDEFKKELLRQFPNVYVKTADLYVAFYARAHDLLRPNGIGCFISSNKWLRAGYGEKLRQNLLDRQAFFLVVDFGELPVFKTAATFPAVFLWQKQVRRDVSTLWAVVKDLQECYQEGIPSYVKRVGLLIKPSQFGPGKSRLTHPENDSIKTQMETHGIRLKEFIQGKIYFGIKTGLNKAFIISRPIRDQLVAEDPRSAEIIKPLVVGDDLRRYEIHYREKFLIWTYIGVSIDHYPAISHHLTQYQKQAEKRWDQGNYWWELRACDYYDQLARDKIIFPDIAKTMRFSIDQSGLFCNNTAYFITPADWYLLGVLNSSSAYTYMKMTCSILGDEDKGGRLRFFGLFLENLPIPEGSEKERKWVAALSQKTQLIHAQRRTRVEQFLESMGRPAHSTSSRNPLEQPWLMKSDEFKKRAPNAALHVFAQARDETAALTEEIERIEKEIDMIVSGLYGID